MLVLLDLDNTLIDRDGAFARWADRYTAALGAGTDGRDWLIAADASGYTPRPELAERMRARFGLDDTAAALHERLLFEHLDGLAFYPGVPERLTALRAAGARLVVVTNGLERQQAQKLERLEVGALVDGWVISEQVGAHKPDPAVFEAAFAVAGDARGPGTGGGPVPGTGGGAVWMVGDHPVADMGGARSLGLRTAWVEHGRRWDAVAPDAGWHPTVSAPTAAATLDAVLDAPG